MVKFLKFQPAERQIPSEEAAIEVQNLSAAYRNERVLDSISFTVPHGKLAAIVGPNGAGKSTLLKAITGLLPNAEGHVFVQGEEQQRRRSPIAYVPQRESVDWDFPVTVLDVVTMGTYGQLGWFRPVNRKVKERAMEALERVELSAFADRQIRQLSGGQQQRTFLARALAQEANLYLMDEPFAAVDAATEEAIVDVLKELRTEGKTCLIVHHDLASVQRYFDWLILLNRRLIAAGPQSTTFTRPNLQAAYEGKLTFIEDAMGTVAGA